jgi:regulator of protease activity HflC (stomatin/prohibitin superfamily)
MTWFGELARFFAKWFPRILVVQWSQGGVKYPRGKVRRVLKPGVHVYWPLLTPVETCEVVRQVIETQVQLLRTKDRVTVAVSCVLEFEVSDVMKFLSECAEPDEAVASVSLGAVKDVITEMTYGDDGSEQDEMDHDLLKALRKSLRPYGVRLLTARLSNLAPVRPIHLTGEGRGD